MAIILTVVATSRDWRALRAWTRDVLAVEARQARATRYRTYRNSYDASQLLILAELPDAEALWALHLAFGGGERSPPLAAAPTEQTWEPTGWEEEPAS
jgi:phosphopantetheinyl transferase